MSVKLDYYIPFKALVGQDAQMAIKENLINIEGVAIDASVNSNKWQVPEEDLDFFAQSLQGAQMRIDHAESAMAVIGKVPEARRNGQAVWFRGEIGDATIIQKVLRGYLTHVSVQVDSDNVECSKCHAPSRKEGMLVHLCPGAWEIVHKPKVRELSIVASPAYKNTEFKPVGFAAAMDRSQKLSPDDAYAEAISKFEHVVNMLQDLKSMEAREKLDLADRLEKLGAKLQNLKRADADARKAYLKTRVAKLQQDVAKLARDEEYLPAESGEKKPRNMQEEFIQAIRQLGNKNSHLARQFEALFAAHSITDFEDYFGNPENMARLRRLAGFPQ